VKDVFARIARIIKKIHVEDVMAMGKDAMEVSGLMNV
jgi:hypothetical protein